MKRNQILLYKSKTSIPRELLVMGERKGELGTKIT